jgi:DNA repair protein SbcD/Mre11
MRFSFIHAADLHIDSPFAGLGVKDPVVAERFAKAGRRAVEALVKEAVDSQAAFLIIAGDVFDGDWKDATTGLFFARALGALHRAEIPTYIVKGNHDADSVMSRSLRYPQSVHSFSSNKAETIELDQYQVALHGRSFGTRKVPEDFVGSYPTRYQGWLNIGILHTGLDGTRGHESYAPCTIDDLKRFGYDYWALGHIHTAEIVSENPWVVYPGNLQGRSIRETGSKGAMRITVEDGRIVEVVPLILDEARWAHENVDVSACTDEAEVLNKIKSVLSDLSAGSGGRPLAVRLTLIGKSAIHTALKVKQEAIEEESRAIGFHFAEDCWVEQVKIRTSAPSRSSTNTTDHDVLDVEALIASTADELEFTESVSELLASIVEKLPREMRNELLTDNPEFIRNIVKQAQDHILGTLLP